MKHEQAKDEDQAPKEMTTPILHSRKNSGKRITSTHKEVAEKITDEKNQQCVCDQNEAKSPCSSPAGPSGDLYPQDDGLVKHKVLPSITRVTKRPYMSQEVVISKSKSKNTFLTQQKPPFVVGRNKLSGLLPISTKGSVNRTSSAFVPMVNNRFHQQCFMDKQINDSLTKSTILRGRKNSEAMKKNLRISVDKTIKRERVEEEKVLNVATKAGKNDTRYDFVNYTQNTKNIGTVLPDEHREVYTKTEKAISNLPIEDVRTREEDDPDRENFFHSEHKTNYIKSEIIGQNVQQMSVVKENEQSREIKLEDNPLVCQYEIVNKKCKEDTNGKCCTIHETRASGAVEPSPHDVVDMKCPIEVRRRQEDVDKISEILTFDVDCCKVEDKNDLNTDSISTNATESARVENLDKHLQIDEFIHDGELAKEENDASHEDACELLIKECDTTSKTISNYDLEKNNLKAVNFDETIGHEDLISLVINKNLLTNSTSSNSLSNYESKLCEPPDDTCVKSGYFLEQKLSTEDNKGTGGLILNNENEVCSDEQRDESDGETVDILQKFVINPHPLDNLKNNTVFDHALAKLLTLEYYGELLARLAKNSQSRLLESLEHVCQNDKVHNAALKSEASVQLDQALDLFIGEFSSTLMSYYNVSAAEANACTFFKWFSRAESEIAADLTEAGDANDNL